MASLWERLKDWLGGGSSDEREKTSEGAELDLVVALRRAAGDLGRLREEIDEAMAQDDQLDARQAELYAASARLFELIADTLTSDLVGIRADRAENWRRAYATGLYRAVLSLVERARLALARPPGQIVPVKTHAIRARLGLPGEADVTWLLTVSDKLEREYETEIAYARAVRRPAEQTRLNELLGLLRSRTHAADTLLGQDLSPASLSPERERLARSVFNEVLAIWLLIAQELVVANVTGELTLGPESAAAEKYDPDDVWLMTDPVAKARYAAEGRLEDLERDIRFEVLRGRPFQPDDLAFAQQIDWLEENGVVKRLASYWATSPHPPIYRAQQAGELRLPDEVIHFERGDEITWLCQMGREMVGCERCVLLGNLNSAKVRKLCGDMHNAMKGMGGHDQMARHEIDG